MTQDTCASCGRRCDSRVKVKDLVTDEYGAMIGEKWVCPKCHCAFYNPDPLDEPV